MISGLLDLLTQIFSVDAVGKLTKRHGTMESMEFPNKLNRVVSVSHHDLSHLGKGHEHLENCQPMMAAGVVLSP